MARYTRRQLVEAAHKAGFRGADLVIAVAISLAENPSMDPAKVSPRNRDGSVDRGAWQINSKNHLPGNPFDLQDNADMAFTLYSHRGHTFKDWVTFNNGAYKLHENVATRAAIHDPHFNIAQEIASKEGVGVSDIGKVPGVIKDGVNKITGWEQALQTLIEHILSPGFWKAVGVGALALLLVIFGLVMMAESNSSIRRATEFAA